MMINGMRHKSKESWTWERSHLTESHELVSGQHSTVNEKGLLAAACWLLLLAACCYLLLCFAACYGVVCIVKQARQQDNKMINLHFVTFFEFLIEATPYRAPKLWVSVILVIRITIRITVSASYENEHFFQTFNTKSKARFDLSRPP